MRRFDGFVLFAEMRTGSNFLEETLNLFPGLQCHGEAFNPGFVGQHNWPDLFGMDVAARDTDPLEMLRRIEAGSDGIGGFRFFHTHEPRILDRILPDPCIAKVFLTRNPLDAYVSRKIASETGQWRLTDEKHRKVAKVRFDAAEFERELKQQMAFKGRVERALKISGQTSFSIDYEETRDLDVINGLAAFLGEEHRLNALSSRLKRQNPAPLSDKVENFAEMQEAVTGLATFGASHSSESEARHGAAVPTFLAAANLPMLFMPVKGGPTEAIAKWMVDLDGADEVEALRSRFNQKTLRQWKNRNKAARSFSVLSHPVVRAHAVFEQFILYSGSGSFLAIRNALRKEFGLPIPDATPDGSYPLDDHRAAFVGFLEFVRRNLAGQTSLRTDPAFSTQSGLIQSMAEVMPPDMVIRADQLDMGLRQLCEQIGCQYRAAPDLAHAVNPVLVGIYDENVEAAVRGAYNRDYMSFGFRNWR